MLTAKLKVKMDAQRKQQASAKKKIANELDARDEDKKPEPKAVIKAPFKMPAALLNVKVAPKTAAKKTTRKKG